MQESRARRPPPPLPGAVSVVEEATVLPGAPSSEEGAEEKEGMALGAVRQTNKEGLDLV
jgi:hypothetical protein